MSCLLVALAGCSHWRYTLAVSMRLLMQQSWCTSKVLLLKFPKLCGIRKLYAQNWLSWSVWLRNVTFSHFNEAAASDRQRDTLPLHRYRAMRMACVYVWRRAEKSDTKIRFICCFISLANCFQWSAVSEWQPADSGVDAVSIESAREIWHVDIVSQI